MGAVLFKSQWGEKKENIPYFFSSILNDANSCQIHLDYEEMIELFISLVDMNT